MFKVKIEKWKSQIRVRHREEIKKNHRDRLCLHEKLDKQLFLYHQCCLISRDREHLDHHNFFDCESFAVAMNKQLFRLIAAIGVQHCKPTLMQASIASILYSLTQTIENKTVQHNQELKAKHYYSRDKVLNSITDLLCLLTQDYDLTRQYGQYIISMLAQALKEQASISTISQKWKNTIIGLQNLFSYIDYQEEIYYGLKSNNLQQIFYKYCLQITENRILIADIDVNLFSLVRNYLEYQKREQQISRNMTRSMIRLISHIFQEDNSVVFEAYPTQLIDQILKISINFNFRNDISLLILKKSLVYEYLSFVQLLNAWTFNQQSISIQDLQLEEIKQMLVVSAMLQFSKGLKYRQLLAGSLFNMACNFQLQIQEAAHILWRCLKETNTVQIYSQLREQESFTKLRSVLHTYPLDDL